MQKKEKTTPGKRQMIALAIYTAVLCLSAQLYAFLAGYELFMQTLATLFALFALVALLTLSIACALLLTTRLPLWLLFACHVFTACWWLGTFYIQTPADVRTFALLLDWYNLGFILVCALPPLLGWALLTYRTRRIRRQAQLPTRA